MATNIDMMDGADFIGRTEVLAWINLTLNLNLNKVEEACSSAVHCQLMDAVVNGIVPMHKVNFHANSEYEMIQNYNEGRSINMEFMQWMKRYYDFANGDSMNNYNALERKKAYK
ncbi:hypothetical protein ACFX13_021714 [Malus domestica]